jgi:hypothetical protein
MFISINVFEITTTRDHSDGKDRELERSFLYPFKD